eukprot:gene12141-25479_t
MEEDSNADKNVTTDEEKDSQDWTGVDVMESMCMSCGDNGTTRLLLHKIPFFRELILASFSCEHCGYQNNEVTFGGSIQPKGCIYELKCHVSTDLDRQLIKSDSASIRIPEIDFEIPPGTQKGGISTLEGFLSTAAKNLSLYQAERTIQSPEIANKVSEIILALLQMSSGSFLPFHIILDDPAGNSFIENPFAPQKDPCLKHSYYSRTSSQDISLGLEPVDALYKEDDSNFIELIEHGFGHNNISPNDNKISTSSSITTTNINISNTDKTAVINDTSAISTENINFENNNNNISNTSTDNDNNDATSTSTSVVDGYFTEVKKEVLSIMEVCPNCTAPAESLMAVTSIPHFKEVIIMAFTCSSCGFRNSEVKAGGAVTLRITSIEDLKRDVLKSDSSMINIPELDLELQHGSLGGVYTTVEGLLKKIYKNLLENNPFVT